MKFNAGLSRRVFRLDRRRLSLRAVVLIQRRNSMIHPVQLIAIAAVVLVVAAGVEQRAATAQTPPTSGGPVDPALVEDLVAANRILSQQGVLDESGHVSIRHPASPNRYLMARSLSPVLVTAEDILE